MSGRVRDHDLRGSRGANDVESCWTRANDQEIPDRQGQQPVACLGYANRLEVRNPGHSIKAEDELGEPGSQTRNPRIAQVLHEINIAETKGSGIRAMRELMQQQGLLPPTFESSRQPDQFVATFLFHHFLEPADIVWLRSLTRETLSDEEMRALVAMRELGAIDNAAYRSLNRTDTLNASMHLRRLRDLGLLVMKGRGNRTYYVPGPSFSTHASQSTAAPSATSTRSDTDTHQSVPDTPQVDPNTHRAGLETRQPSAPIDAADLPADLRARLPAPRTRPRKAVLRELLVKLCAWRPLSARELAALLGRQDHKHLVRELLSPMVDEGLLAHTIPTMESHPEQRYAARTPVAG